MYDCTNKDSHSPVIKQKHMQAVQVVSHMHFPHSNCIVPRHNHRILGEV